MSVKECTGDRAKKCAREEDDGFNKCTEERDQGYNACTQSRDNGYKSCCDWAPCSWFCRAWVWVSHVVCVVWTWISNLVCVAWTWIKNIICVAWVYLTALICLIPGIGKYITHFLDGVVDTVLGVIGGVIGGIIDFIGHPIESIGTIISLFGGCPDVRANDSKRLEIIAHHGSAYELPENTVQSCARALALGSNALEIDVCMTADEQLILWHDWDPDSLISVTRQAEIAQPHNAFKPDVPTLGDDWRKPCIELTLAEFRAHYTYQDERDALTKIKWDIDHGPVDLSIATLAEFFAATVRWETLRTVYIDVKMPASAALRYAGVMADQIHALIVGLERAFNVIVMVPDSLVLQTMKARADEKQYALIFTWDVEFPAGVVLNPRRYSAIDHSTSSLFHNAAASVGRPTAVTLFPWRTYRRTIEYDIGRWNDVNADPATQNAGIRIGSCSGMDH